VKLIFLKNNSTSPKTLNLSKGLIVSFCGFLILIAGLLIGVGISIGKPNSQLIANYERLSSHKMDELIEQEKLNIQKSKQYIENNLVALSARLGGLQAQVSRINAVEKRLASSAEIDLSAFDYTEEPAQGGQESISLNVTEGDLIDEIASMEAILDRREMAIKALGVSLSELVLKEDQTPEGMPVENSWISSGFGWRASPISGKKRFHRGADVPGKHGADVLAVADGIVVRSEMVADFGNVVEINHGEGLTTLYGHNSKNLVSIGESVMKGDSIAKVGSTGRSTGPHVHFEVRKYGKALNPRPFLR
jgi:murein DD-endopeptidase MepM/ murein hydrolase activator NlpD